MTTRQHVIAFLAAAGLTIAVHAADETARVTPAHSTTDAPGTFPDLRVPDGLGVNIHYFSGLTTNDLDQMRAAGFRFIREDFAWSRVEKQKEVYDFQPYDDLTRELKQRGLRALYILDYGNKLYEPSGMSVQTEPGRQAFARFAAAAAARYRGQGIVWELWNEPDVLWYDWRNDGSDPQNMEHNFGTVTFDRQPKPGYRVVQKLTEALGGMRFVKRLDTPPDEWRLLFTDGDRYVIAAWTTSQPRSAEIIPGRRVELTEEPQFLPMPPGVARELVEDDHEH